jgi:3,5-dihydroxyphenylacetyl-CoA synthase
MLSIRPCILSVGTANPPHRYTQREILDLFRPSDPRIESLFLSTHIDTRYLFLPEPGPDGTMPVETQAQLLEKHRKGGIQIASEAVRRCLEPLGMTPQDIDYLCCTTVTGFLTPGLSAWLIRELGFREDCSRLDVVGMGCNAGLNSLNPVNAWCLANPGGNALLVCIEVCSATYVDDDTMRTAVVNSLFGDGSAAALIRADPVDEPRFAPRILGFESQIVTSAIGAMRYEWDSRAGKFSFFLDPNIPYVVGQHAEKPVDRLLRRFGLHRRDIDHWLVHSGGKKVIDALMYNIGLTAHDVRHTLSVLRDYGNLSSGSFLFSYRRLMEEGVVERGDWGVMVTMGPGTTIETALIRW